MDVRDLKDLISHLIKINENLDFLIWNHDRKIAVKQQFDNDEITQKQYELSIEAQNCFDIASNNIIKGCLHLIKANDCCWLQQELGLDSFVDIMDPFLPTLTMINDNLLKRLIRWIEEIIAYLNVLSTKSNFCDET